MEILFYCLITAGAPPGRLFHGTVSFNTLLLIEAPFEVKIIHFCSDAHTL